ncbi:MAG: ROK family protein [Opitutaceae bacterium]|jgi:predicted NBD/HSP70 family sugar kinase|nr:ROK family protein [Opitutaceae bacterium]
MISPSLTCVPKLDPNFVPAALWNRAYQKSVESSPESLPLRIAIARPNGTTWTYDTKILPDTTAHAAATWLYCERLIKFLLWAWGGSRVRIAGAPHIVAQLQQTYSANGARSFDYEFIGTACFGEAFQVEAAAFDELRTSTPVANDSKNPLKGNRIGFDLGGSDRKCAAMIDGEVVFSEEIKWNPYFESDPEYHRAGIAHSLQRAAAHLPHVDAIGGSAAGIYIDNEPRVGSLFRGVSPADFDRRVRSIFKDLQAGWNDVPFEVANDGDVTAIAGSMAINDSAVLGIAMGTSLAAGFINPDNRVTGWINELAFCPVDYRSDAPADEWSGDIGCGVQYFSQQAVGRLIPASGLEVDQTLGLPEKLEAVQARMKEGDERAAAIYETIGTCLGYSIAHYRDFYEFRNLLVLGRVSSGAGGDMVLAETRRVLDLEFPELSPKITFQTPDEKTKRHGQAIAAASLPQL